MDATRYNADYMRHVPKHRRTRHNSYKEATTSSRNGYEVRLWKNSRRPRNGYGRGLPKKGGAGGKGVWGAPGSEMLETFEDVNDPNFDDDSLLMNGDIELKALEPAESYEEVRKKVDPIVLEYFENGDTEEIGSALIDVVPRHQRDFLLEQLIEAAMEHKPSHCELTSNLICDLHGIVVHEADISKAFQSLLAKVNELKLDIPDAPVLLGNFIARAIADDCIPPAFLKITKAKSDNVTFQQAISRAEALLSLKNGRLLFVENVWGVGGALRPVKSLIRQMSLLLNEYLEAKDVAEASRCLSMLEVPHFHHEIVYEAIVKALEVNNVEKEEAICTLLKAFDKAMLVTPYQMEHGFLRVFDDLPDMYKDIPLVYIILPRFLERCYKAGFISDEVMEKMPNKGRKRFVSEGDQDYIKSFKSK